MKVTIDYFKPESGKYYSRGEYESEHSQMWQVFDEVKAMFAAGVRPGLIDGPLYFYAVVDSAAGYPTLIFPVITDDDEATCADLDAVINSLAASGEWEEAERIRKVNR